jgi:predicted O-methyltransferase YrrM
MNRSDEFSAKMHELCARMLAERGSWITGSLSQADAHFLFRSAVEARTRLAVEIGTASGFSTAVLCQALKFASDSGMIDADFEVVSYDASDRFYADPTRPVGDAARELLPADLMRHITFRHPTTALKVREHYGPDELDFLFIDANHHHPWPTLDLLACLDYLKPGATVVLHDINLPIIHPQFPAWGVHYLFEGLDEDNRVPAEERMPNIGSIRIPEDKEGLRGQLVDIFFRHEAGVEVNGAYLAGVGIPQVRPVERAPIGAYPI